MDHLRRVRADPGVLFVRLSCVKRTAVVQRSRGCAAVRVNRIAGDDNPQLAARPPFPVHNLANAH